MDTLTPDVTKDPVLDEQPAIAQAVAAAVAEKDQTIADLKTKVAVMTGARQTRLAELDALILDLNGQLQDACTERAALQREVAYLRDPIPLPPVRCQF